MQYVSLFVMEILCLMFAGFWIIYSLHCWDETKHIHWWYIFVWQKSMLFYTSFQSSKVLCLNGTNFYIWYKKNSFQFTHSYYSGWFLLSFSFMYSIQFFFFFDQYVPLKHLKRDLFSFLQNYNEMIFLIIKMNAIP